MSSEHQASSTLGNEILQGLDQAIEYVNGFTETHVVHQIPIPDVAAIRKKLQLSQSDFAERFHIPQATVRNWEQGRRVPETTACLLLRMIEKDPQTVERLLSGQ